MTCSSQRLAGLCLAVLFSICVGICNAQEVGGARSYLFQATGISTTQRAKQLTELLRGFDGEMVVSLDQPTQRLKLVTTEVLDENGLITMAGQVGVTLVRIPIRTTAQVVTVTE